MRIIFAFVEQKKARELICKVSTDCWMQYVFVHTHTHTHTHRERERERAFNHCISFRLAYGT